MNDTYRKPWYSFGCVGAMTSTDVRNLGRFNLWAMGWALSWVATIFALKLGGETAPGLRHVLAAVPIAMAVATIAAYLHFIRHADELLRKIHLEGMAWGFGVAFVLTTAGPLLEGLGVPAIEPAVLFAAMVVGWAFGQLSGRRRYA